MSRTEPRKPSLCGSSPLNGSTISQPLAVLSELMRSCYGPSGRLKQVHNGMGGCICTTSESSALLSGVTVTHSALKLLTTCVMNHTSRFSDCGLFAAIFCCSLIENLQRVNSPPSNVGKIFRHLLKLCLDYLNTEDCGCRLPADFSNSKILLSVVRSVVTSKPACMLTVSEADYISTVVLKAFLLTVPDDVGKSSSLGKIIVIPLEGQRVMDSAIVNGLLIEMPRFQLEKRSDVIRVSLSHIKMALFGISMAGDLSDVGDGTLEVMFGVRPEAAVLEQLLAIGKQMVNDKVGLVVCQKVIHPVLKQYLQECHVMVIDRVGAALLDPLVQMTGAQPIGSFQSPVSSTCYGSLMDVCAVRFGSKQFFHLIPCHGTVCSLVLCNRNETSLNELKRVCQTAEHVLQLTLKQPLVLLGGGCTETHLASYIRHQSTSVSDGTLSVLGCSRSEYQIAADIFCCSMGSVARSLEHDGGKVLVDAQYGHCWVAQPDPPPNYDWADVISQCGCGMYKKQENMNVTLLGNNCKPLTSKEWHSKPPTTKENLVLDCFSGKCNALQVATETANVILELKYVIQDQN